MKILDSLAELRVAMDGALKRRNDFVKKKIVNAKELRVKETDRIKALCENLNAAGAEAEEFPDGLKIRGPTKFRAAKIRTCKDHRIAMAFAVAGLCSAGPMQISDTEFVATSFPGFFDLMASVTR